MRRERAVFHRPKCCNAEVSGEWWALKIQESLVFAFSIYRLAARCAICISWFSLPLLELAAAQSGRKAFAEKDFLTRHTPRSCHCTVSPQPDGSQCVELICCVGGSDSPPGLESLTIRLN